MPEYELQKCVKHNKGDYRLKKLTCRGHFLIMSFAQLTVRASLRDIKSCLTAFIGELYHSGFSQPVYRSTLADANEKRDLGIYDNFAQILMKQARPLYIEDIDFRVDLDNIVYAFESNTIDLYLSLYPWAKFYNQMGAVKMHHWLDLRGSIPMFIDINEGSVPLCQLAGCNANSARIFVIRTKEYLICEVISPSEFDKDSGL